MYGDQMKIADQIRSRMISEKMRRSMTLGYEEAKYGYNPCRSIVPNDQYKTFSSIEPSRKHGPNVPLRTD
ncbi:hypothetical protein NECAME_10176 [Necator americanus]|uniref:Uncharacterized protein n=1 Tax=Necator americanus TaxID=51031 RepID=W2TCJ4_NECAM|nr:hypothetical protein NECAME_10176 [Necator americanus]ETN78737.1 hypothetical protein NECAME_10176 [Necator americanus]